MPKLVAADKVPNLSFHRTADKLRFPVHSGPRPPLSL